MWITVIIRCIVHGNGCRRRDSKSRGIEGGLNTRTAGVRPLGGRCQSAVGGVLVRLVAIELFDYILVGKKLERDRFE